ncbi:MAG: sulfide/dihydroorotate dehydrogenase-like FAD/NAD-binding protein [Firmicutes bacterium]|jgi:ferredoxin--NADP+ reductase|nr:sulfide/dihydroorotate dehydrogenase-like FAD/NAD-binding protein [Bacillota bacterium]
MFRIVDKNLLAPGVHRFEVEAPLVARRARPGNFVIVRTTSKGERIPLTIVSHDAEKGTIILVVQEIGKSTAEMGLLRAGDSFTDVVGPLGTPTRIEKVGTVVAVAGGIGVAPILPQIRAHREIGNHVITIVGARTRNLLILTDEVEAGSHEVIYATDDGSLGYHGFVSGALEELIKSGRTVNEVIAIGPVRMMQATANVARKYDIPTTVSLNAIMVDGTGMCGCCRVTVDGEVKFSCVDGPEFDGHKVDFDELIARQSFFCAKEKVARDRFEAERGACQCHGR